MKFEKRSGDERIGEMTLWSTGNKYEEGEVVLVKEE